MKRLIVDANILIRAMLGVNVLSKLERHRETVQFLTSETAYIELERHLPRVLSSKHPIRSGNGWYSRASHYCAIWSSLARLAFKTAK